jgi:hypothetical protein
MREVVWERNGTDGPAEFYLKLIADMERENPSRSGPVWLRRQPPPRTPAYPNGRYCFQPHNAAIALAISKLPHCPCIFAFGILPASSQPCFTM